ncbi:MAG: cytochrome c [Sphaerobacteraceae bacterium]|nr:MAG: cytochrome c [Sphaerobacteraceae bacterium]
MMGRLVGVVLLIIGVSGICAVIATSLVVDVVSRSDLGFLRFDYSRDVVQPRDSGATLEFASLEDRGEVLFELNCSGCHSIDGSRRTGPTMKGIFGSTVEMDDGATVTVYEEHIREAITNPRRTTRRGFQDVMPAFDTINHEDLDALVAFIRTLEK